MAPRTLSINRVPVLTLWASVVAARLGFDRAEALTIGRAVAGLNARAKGRRLKFFKPHEEKPKPARGEEHGEKFLVDLLSRAMPGVNTPVGIRAVPAGEPINPGGVETHLEGKFGDDLPAVRSAMKKLARCYTPAELSHAAYALYERFRPVVPAGKWGWGAKGVLDLGLIGRLAEG